VWTGAEKIIYNACRRTGVGNWGRSLQPPKAMKSGGRAVA